MKKVRLKLFKNLVAKSSSSKIGIFLALCFFLLIEIPILLIPNKATPTAPPDSPSIPLTLQTPINNPFELSPDYIFEPNLDHYNREFLGQKLDLDTPTSETPKTITTPKDTPPQKATASYKNRYFASFLALMLSCSMGWLAALFHHTILQKDRDQKDLLELLNNLTSQIPGMVYQFEMTESGRRRFPYASWGAKKILELKAESLQEDATPVFQRIHPEDIKAVETSIKNSARDLTPWNHVFRYHSRDGSYKWLHGQSVPERLSSKSVLWHGFVTDVTKRIDRESTLKDSEERWNLALGGTNVGVWDWNILTDEVFFSNRWKEMIGYESDEISPNFSEWKKHIHPDDVKEVFEKLDKHLAGYTEYYESTQRMQHKNGSWIWILSRGKAHFDANDNPVRMVGTQTDITLQKTMEKQIKENESRFRDVLEAAGENVWETDTQCRYTYLSQRIEKEIGYTPDELQGKTPFSLVLEEDRERITNWFSQVMKERICFSNLSYRIRRKNGSIMWQKVSGLPLYNQQGKLIGYRGAFLDITQVKQAQVDIQQLNDRFKFAQKAAKFGVWDYDIIGDNLVWDLISLELYNLPLEQFTGKLSDWEKTLLPEDREQAKREMMLAIKNKDECQIEFRIAHQDQSIHYLRVQAHIYRNAEGKPERAIGITSDITEDKNNEVAVLRSKEQAEIASKAKSDFLAMMSHEIRTPMNGIIGFSKLLSGTELTIEQNDYARTIITSAELLLTLINDILDYSKIESGKLELEHLPVEPESLIEDIHKLLLPQANSKFLKFTYEICPGVPEFISSDPIRLHQILLNLSNNAIKFTEQGSVHIEVTPNKEEDDSLIFSITDTGIGIPKDRQDLLFKPFSQTDSSNARLYGGTGLGLAICRQLCELFGGQIWAESEVGKGAKFFFTINYIPVTTETKKLPKTKPKESSAQKATNDHIKILLAEDNPVNAKLVQIMFKRLGYKLTWAKNGKEAVKEAEQNQFDLIFMDVQMPEMDGYQATHNIRCLTNDKERQRPVIIAMTANAMKGDREKCLEAGMDDYLTKPIQEAQVSEVINKYQDDPNKN